MRPSCQCLTFLACSRQIEIIGTGRDPTRALLATSVTFRSDVPHAPFLRWPLLHTLRSASSKFARCHRWAVQGFTTICPLELREIRANTAKCASKPGWSPSHAQILGHTGGPPQSGAPKPQDAPLRSSSSGPPRQVCLRPPCALGCDGCFLSLIHISE